MIALVLCALAPAMLWWPRTRAEARLAGLRTPAGAGLRGIPRWRTAALLVVPVLGGAVGGMPTAVAAGLLAAYWWRRGRAAARAARQAEQDEAVLAVLASVIAEMSVGAPAALACATAVSEIDSRAGAATRAVAAELSGIAGRATLGGAILDDRDDDRSIPGCRRIAVIWQISDTFGLPMLDLLRALRSDMLARKDFRTRTLAGLAGPRATAMVLAGLPAVGILLGQAMGADPLGVLLGGGLPGVLLIVGTALVIAGMAWSERITRRVVGG